MKVLTDTHTLVWALSDPGQLGPEARRILTEAEVLASVANLWELLLKKEKQNALLVDPLAWWNKYVLRSGIRTLAVRVKDVMKLGELPPLHKDPFDRMLAAQSLVEQAPLISKDRRLADYGVSVLW